MTDQTPAPDMTGLNGTPAALFVLLMLAGFVTAITLPCGVCFIFWGLAASIAGTFGVAALMHKGVR